MSSCFLIGAASLPLSIWAQQNAPGINPLLFGADYYPDQTPEAQWEEDARMIAAAGLTNVRTAEFGWGPRGVEMTVRTSGGKRWTFLLNHTAEVQTVGLVMNFTDILTGEKLGGQVSVGGYGVRILQGAS